MMDYFYTMFLLFHVPHKLVTLCTYESPCIKITVFKFYNETFEHSKRKKNLLLEFDSGHERKRKILT